MVSKVFIKLGGSFITDKAVPETLNGERITAAARMIRAAIEAAAAQGDALSIILGHGAGSFGHIAALKFSAVQGVHPEFGWQGLYAIREAMTRMNLLVLQRCKEGGLYPVTVSPFAVTQAKGGKVLRLDAENIQQLLLSEQIPLVHGDAVPDTERGFTIASTEALLAALGDRFRFDRVVMVSDTPGVLDQNGRTIPLIDRRNLDQIAACLGASGAPDVTGGMRKKVENLLALIRRGAANEARILTFSDRPEDLRDAVLGAGEAGTLLRL